MSAERQASGLTVAIMPLGDVSLWHIQLTEFVLEKEYGVKTMLLPTAAIPTRSFSLPREGRYQYRPILEFLLFHLPDNAQRIIGIVAGEVEDENNATFGPSGGCSYSIAKAAMYSVLPLSKWELLSQKEKLKKDRTSYIVIAHEFGHTLGLKHCNRPDCLMYEAPQGKEMCANCRERADRELLGYNPN